MVNVEIKEKTDKEQEPKAKTPFYIRLLRFYESPYFYAMISGILTALSATYQFLFWVAWFSLIPLIYALIGAKGGIRRSMLIMFVFALFYYTILYTWFTYVNGIFEINNNKKMGTVLILAAWFSTSIAQSLQLMLVGLFFGLIKPKKVFAPIVVAAIWTIIEFVQGFGELAMNWGRLAITQVPFLASVQSASVFGSLFISFWLIVINGLLAYAIYEAINNKLNLKAIYIATAIIFALNICFGITRIPIVDSIEKKQQQSTIKAAAIQADMPAVEKWEMTYNDIFDIYYRLTEEAAQNGAKMIFLPETALVIFMSPKTGAYKSFGEIADKYNTYIFMGAFTESADGLEFYNSVITIYPTSSEYEEHNYQEYHKRKLVPFSEFVPFENILMKLGFLDLLSLVDSVTSGRDAVVFETPLGNVSSLICFDTIFQRYSYQSVNKGANILSISTNDSWFLGSAATYQHYNHARLRAVENNRWLVRAANAGVSMIVSPSGKIVCELGLREEGYIMADIRPISRRTFYSITGDSLIISLLLAYLAFCFVYFRFIEKKRINKNIFS